MLLDSVIQTTKFFDYTWCVRYLETHCLERLFCHRVLLRQLTRHNAETAIIQPNLDVTFNSGLDWPVITA